MACAINTTHPNEAIKKFLIDNCAAIKENSDCYNESLKAINDANYTAKSKAWNGETGPDTIMSTIKADPDGKLASNLTTREKEQYGGCCKADYDNPDTMADFHTSLPTPVEDLNAEGSYQQVLDNALKVPEGVRETVTVQSQYGSAQAPMGDMYTVGSVTRAWQKVKATQTLLKYMFTEYAISDADKELAKAWYNDSQKYLDNLWNLALCTENLQKIAKEYKDLVKAEAEKGEKRKKELTDKIKKCRNDRGDQKLKAADCLTPDELAELQAQVVLNQAAQGTGALANVGAQVATASEPTKRTFKEQCLLLSNVKHFTDYREQTLLKNAGKRKPYRTYKATSGSIRANASLEVDRQPWGFMNHLVQSPSYSTMFDLTTYRLSQLQPMISLFKVTTDKAGAETETPIHCDSVYNPELDSILLSTNKRGFGVGIQNFTFTYKGSDPFSVKKSIQAKLSIYASSLDDLLQPRGAYRYVDLALKSAMADPATPNDVRSAAAEDTVAALEKDAGVTSDDNAQTAKPFSTEGTNLRLKAVVGWAKPHNLTGVTQQQTDALNDAIDNAFVTLQLTPTIHEFDIREDGSVVFHIEYLAYVEEFFDRSSFNIFSEIEIQKRNFERTHTIAALKADCSEKATEKLKTYLEEQSEKIDDDKRAQLAAIINQLLAMKRLFFKPIPYESLNSFNLQGPYWKFDLYGDTQGEIAESDKDKTEASKVKKNTADATSSKKEKPKTDPNLSETQVQDINLKEYISFFYLGDLVDVILQNIETTLEDLPGSLSKIKKPDAVSRSKWSAAVALSKREMKQMHTNYKQLRVLLGPIEIFDTASQEFKIVNLGDLPISVAYFMDWLTDKTLKRDNPEYNLPIFLKELINNLVRNFLNEPKCFDINVNQKISLFQSVVTSYNNSGTDEITELIEAQGSSGSRSSEGYHSNGKLWLSTGTGTPVLNVMGERNSAITNRAPKKTFNYMIFYAGRTQPQEFMQGTPAVDAAAGIFHYVQGRDTGLIKNIQLIQTDSPGLREVRFEQEGYDGLQQLRPQFDANVTCYGSPNIVPGTYIFIDPEGFAPNARTIGFDRKKLTQLGIGGYYMVIESENSYGPGVCETKFTAKWVAQIGVAGTSAGKKVRTTTTKCKDKK